MIMFGAHSVSSCHCRGHPLRSRRHTPSILFTTMFYSVLLLLLSLCVLSPLISADNEKTNTQHPEDKEKDDGKVRNLQAEPDYRAIRLRWTYKTHNLDNFEGFTLRYCEHGLWHTKTRCRKHNLTLGGKNNIREGASPKNASSESEAAIVQLFRLPGHRFEALVSNLRMLTNYTVTVGVQHQHQHHHKATTDTTEEIWTKMKNSKDSVRVETKSFSAKTSRCLANTSEIEVFTGPYFGGKISVEGSTSASCVVYGDKDSSKSVYTFVIDYNLCGSKLINKSRIETMVIVHENRDILTHNSRRYFVVCTFHSNVHLLTASVAVPKHLLRKYFDRLKEKEVRLSAHNVITSGLEANTGNTSRADRLVPDKLVVSHLRNSRMLTEDGKAKLVGTSTAQAIHFPLALGCLALALALLSIGAWLGHSGRHRGHG